MKVQYFSDVHLEFASNDSKIRRMLEKIEKNADICIVAGDLGYPFLPTYKQFLEGLSIIFEHVIIIHGNHEYYQFGKQKGKTMEEIREKTRDICKEIANVHFLDNSYIDLPCSETGKMWRFIGTTLWSNIFLPRFTVNDKINIDEFSVENNNSWHAKNNEFLEETINSSELDCIVITHHLPSFNIIDEEYSHGMYKMYNQCYASRCDDLIKSPVKAWIYGHTHKPAKNNMNDIMCVCNPIGYPGENKKISFNEMIDL
jgi:predicted phosphodiesterase